MKNLRCFALGTVLAGFVSVGAMTAPAAAQTAPGTQPQALQPPTPGKPDRPPAVMNFLTMIIILGLVIGANLVPSKRGHQD